MDFAQFGFFFAQFYNSVYDSSMQKQKVSGFLIPFVLLLFFFISPPSIFAQAPFFEKFGVQHLTGHEKDWSSTVEAGAAWVRINPEGISPWARIEPQNNVYDWSKSADWTATGGVGLNKNIIGIIAGASNPEGYPSWAATNKCGPIDKVSLDEFAEFAKNLVERWDGDGTGDAQPPVRIGTWEILNEPDTRMQGDVFIPECWGDHPELYAELLKKTYTVIKQADPTARVTTGGFAICAPGTPNCQGTSLFNPDFLERFLSVPDIGNFFDYLNFHYYEIESSAWQEYGPGVAGKVNYVKQKLQEHGINKPMIVSETNACNGQLVEGKTYTEQDQANFMHKFAARALSLPEVADFNWWEIKDTKDYANCGFYRFDPAHPAFEGDKKPSYYALRSLDAYLANVYQTLPLFIFAGSMPSKEGYLLTSSRQVWWTNNNQSQAISIMGKTIQVTDTDTGSLTNITDGGVKDEDTVVNGRIGIQITDVPKYIEILASTIPPAFSIMDIKIGLSHYLSTVDSLYQPADKKINVFDYVYMIGNIQK